MALDQLREQLAAALHRQDFDAAKALRLTLQQQFPDSDEAAEATYRLGLDALFRGRDLEAALLQFETAAKMKHAYWSAAARTSMALCYAQQKRLQKAMFELRKVALVKDPSAHSVAALTWMETLAEGEGDAEEASKARAQRVAQLKQLLAGPALSASDKGEYLYQLGCALLDQKQRSEGRAALQEAKALGAQVVGPDVMRGINEALKG